MASCAASAKSEIVALVCVPVCVERSRSALSVAFAVAPVATPASLVRSVARNALLVVPSVTVSAVWVPV